MIRIWGADLGGDRAHFLSAVHALVFAASEDFQVRFRKIKIKDWRVSASPNVKFKSRMHVWG
ncbi:hypothetical protein CU048_12120 [Beijerinckiaceae bacterium]|nr:hypothetical protein CU048_12120 [Beijerinckiaceae bacterium]